MIITCERCGKQEERVYRARFCFDCGKIRDLESTKQAQRRRRAGLPNIKQCKLCGKSFEAKGNQQYCSAECAAHAHRDSIRRVGGETMLDKLIRLFDPRDVDPITITEVERFAQKKYDEQAKIKGQIARDLARIGERAFEDPAAYDKLRAKYKAHWTNTKRLAILDMMKRKWTHEKTA